MVDLERVAPASEPAVGRTTAKPVGPHGAMTRDTKIPASIVTRIRLLRAVTPFLASPSACTGASGRPCPTDMPSAAGCVKSAPSKFSEVSRRPSANIRTYENRNTSARWSALVKKSAVASPSAVAASSATTHVATTSPTGTPVRASSTWCSPSPQARLVTADAHRARSCRWPRRSPVGGRTGARARPGCGTPPHGGGLRSRRRRTGRILPRGGSRRRCPRDSPSPPLRRQSRAGAA